MLQELEAFKAAVDAAKDIRTLCGAKGKNAARINQQLIVANEERLNGAPVFVGVEYSSQCLCIAADGDWVVQPVEYKGTNRCYAHIKDKISPLHPAAQWMVSNGGFENQSVRIKSRITTCRAFTMGKR